MINNGKIEKGKLIFMVRNSNPNGDPDLDGAPRTQNGTNIGFATAVSIKSKIRQILRLPPIIDSLENKGLIKDNKSYLIYEGNKPEREASKNLTMKEFRERYLCTRLFGTTHLDDEKNKKNKENIVIRGPVSMTDAFSINEIEINECTYTKIVPVQSNKSCGMAPDCSKVVKFGLYHANIEINPMWFAEAGTDSNDIDILKYVLPMIFELTKSCSRPDIHVVSIPWITYKNNIDEDDHPLRVSGSLAILESWIPIKICDKPTNINDFHFPDIKNEVTDKFEKYIEDIRDLAPFFRKNLSKVE